MKGEAMADRDKADLSIVRGLELGGEWSVSNPDSLPGHPAARRMYQYNIVI